MILFGFRDEKILKRLNEVAESGEPISESLEIKTLSDIKQEQSLVEALKILVSTCHRISKPLLSDSSNSESKNEKSSGENAANEELSTLKLKTQTALLDVAEFITTNHTELCSKHVETLKLLRPVITDFESLVQKLRDAKQIDFRAISLFMDNTVGEKKFFPVGPMGSIFRKTKSKAFRAVECTWEEREKMMEKMLNLVPDKRRHFLTAGRSEIRGYKDMSDQELKAWLTFGLEIHDDDE